MLITYSSEGDESFYRFEEQSSHIVFKGRRVPMFVQEQGVCILFITCMYII